MGPYHSGKQNQNTNVQLKTLWMHHRLSPLCHVYEVQKKCISWGNNQSLGRWCMQNMVNTTVVCMFIWRGQPHWHEQEVNSELDSHLWTEPDEGTRRQEKKNRISKAKTKKLTSWHARCSGLLASQRNLFNKSSGHRNTFQMSGYWRLSRHWRHWPNSCRLLPGLWNL